MARRIKTPQIRDNETKRRIFLLALGVVLLLLFIGLLSWLSYHERYALKTFTVEGNFALTKEEIIEAVDENLRGAYGYLFSKRNSLMYPEKFLETHLLQRFGRLATVDIIKRDRTTLLIRVTERKPFAMWCSRTDTNDEVSTSTAGKYIPDCYFMDESSYIYAQAPTFSGYVFFVYRGNLEGQEILNKRYMELVEFNGLRAFLDVLTQEGFRPVSYTRGKEGDAEFYLEAKEDTPYPITGNIIVRADDTYDHILDTLITVVENSLLKDYETELSKGPIRLEYIDLRFGNKVYYKLEEETK